MSEDSSARLALPLMWTGQAQKELWHNEALTLLDIAAMPAAVDLSVTTPPADPVEGDCWIVGADATGAWTGRAGQLAGWTAGGWRFVDPPNGARVWIIAAAAWAQRGTSGWTILAPLPAPSGGGVVDAEARTAIAALIEQLRSHGIVG